jgi:hypothetical protein
LFKTLFARAGAAATGSSVYLQYTELVTTQTSDRVARVDAATKEASEYFKKLISRRVSKLIINLLEFIKIKQMHGKLTARLITIVRRLLKAFI